MIRKDIHYEVCEAYLLYKCQAVLNRINMFKERKTSKKATNTIAGRVVEGSEPGARC